MNYQYLNLNSHKDIIEGTIVRKLIEHKDPTGSLVETLRRDWNDVFDAQTLPFAMQYMSITPPKIARDEDKWHVHKNQEDRFICISGRIVTALYDPRDSATKGRLNLFLMGAENEEEMYILVIPKDVYHGFMVISHSSGYLLNFPTQLYNPADEGRVPNQEFSWQTVREDFNIK